jgi:lysozyme family protein
MRLELLPPKLRLFLFDSAVNMGPGTAIGLAQAALGLKPTGRYDADFFTAIKAQDEHDMLRVLAAQRFRAYYHSKNWATFGVGWTRRLIDVALRSAATPGATSPGA